MKRSPLRKHANEQPADQIAAEAASEIMANYVPASSADRANIDGIQTVILSAIEKARKLQMDEDDAMWSAKLEAESLAAHGTSAAADASECICNDGFGMNLSCPIHGKPAHANEPLRDSPEYRDQLRSNPRTCHLTHGKPAHASEPLLQRCRDYLLEMRVDGVNQPQLESLITELSDAAMQKEKE